MQLPKIVAVDEKGAIIIPKGHAQLEMTVRSETVSCTGPTVLIVKIKREDVRMMMLEPEYLEIELAETIS